MFKVYDPISNFKVRATASTLHEAFLKAKYWAHLFKREQWIDDPSGRLCAVASAR